MPYVETAHNEVSHAGLCPPQMPILPLVHRENAELRVRMDEASSAATVAASDELAQYREEAAAVQAELTQLSEVIVAQEATAAAEQELRTRVSLSSGDSERKRPDSDVLHIFFLHCSNGMPPPAPI